jgi:hypothetical protein
LLANSLSKKFSEADVVHATHSRQQQMPVAQPLFPSSILSIVPLIIEMLDDVQVDKYGISGILTKNLQIINF